MALLGTCVLLVCHDYLENDEDDFNEWYIREHLPERADGMPGFNRGRRYVAIDEAPKYLAFYEAADAKALASDAYLKLVRNFDPRSRHFVSKFQNTVRTVSAVRASAGHGETGLLGLLGFETGAAATEALRSLGGQQLVNRLVTRPGIVGAHLLEADLETLAQSQRTHIRQNDRTLPWTLMVEAIHQPALSSIWQDDLEPESLGKLGITKTFVRGSYRLLFGVRAGDGKAINRAG